MVLAQAERRHSDARDALADAQGRIDALTERLADLQAERAAIVGRRARGDCRDTDRGDVELIAVDLEGIEQALSRATPERDRLAAVARETRESLSRHERGIAADKERSVQQTLREFQTQFEDAIVEIAAQFKAHSALSGGHWWLNNVELKNLTRPR